MTTTTTQVVIIGAGPTGLSLAAQLMRHGVDFILLDKKAGTTPLSKAIVIQPRSLEIFDEINLAEKAVKEGQITTAINLFYKGRRRTAVNLTGLGQGLSAFPFVLSLEQSKTEKLLADHLVAHGKKISWNAEVTGFTDHGNSVSVRYNTAAAGEQEIVADYLVGCDGAASWVRHELDLSFEGSTEPKLFYVADVVLNSPVINTDELFMFMISKGFVLFFPMEGEGHYRIVGIIPGPESAEREYSFDDVGPAIKQSVLIPLDFKEVRWFSTYKVHSRMAVEFSKGRCFIAGDAAHIHTPAGGQGMNTGIQDAYNLAWKIAYALRGEINDEALASYNTERCANARNLLRTTDRMFDFMSGSNRFWNFLRLNFFPLVLNSIASSRAMQKRFFPLISQTGIHYPESFLNDRSVVGHAKAGDRMPYFVFSNGKSVFSYLREPFFKLLYFGDEENNDSFELAESKIKMIAISFSEVPSAIFDETDFYILLRPDNHISYIGKEIDRCEELIEKISPLSSIDGDT